MSRDRSSTCRSGAGSIIKSDAETMTTAITWSRRNTKKASESTGDTTTTTDCATGSASGATASGSRPHLFVATFAYDHNLAMGCDHFSTRVIRTTARLRSLDGDMERTAARAVQFDQ